MMKILQQKMSIILLKNDVVLCPCSEVPAVSVTLEVEGGEAMILVRFQ